MVLGGVQYLKRRYTITCKSCGHKMTSELSFTSYLILIVYVQVITMLVGALFVLAVVGGYWLFAVVALFAFFLLTVPPAMALHIRSLGASNSELR
jgi:hypothetical protein